MPFLISVICSVNKAKTTRKLQRHTCRFPRVFPRGPQQSCGHSWNTAPDRRAVSARTLTAALPASLRPPESHMIGKKAGPIGTQHRNYLTQREDFEAQSTTELTRGRPELVHHFQRGSSHRRKNAACPKCDMVWLNRSPIPVGRRGVISSCK